MLMINVLLHEEGRRNRCSQKKTIVGKRLLEKKSVKVKERRTGPSLELISIAANSK